MYDAGLGRFISADVVEPDLTNPQTLNRYTYCLNNPLKYVDPTGEWWQLAVAVVSQYIMMVVSSPDFQQDVDQLYIDAITGDVGGMAIDAVSVAIPGLYAVTAKGAIKAADKVIDTVKGVDKAADVGKAVDKSIVIGENMKERIIPAAKELGAKYYKPRQKKLIYTLEEKIKKNVKWLKDKIKKGYEVINKGIDRTRSKVKRSPFYKAEKKEVDKAIKKGTLKSYKKIK